MERMKSREVKVGNLGIGGENPIRIKGMLKSRFSLKEMVKEVKRLEKEGAQLIRVAFMKESNLKILKELKKIIQIPLVADIHFHPRLATKAIEAGFDGIRLNPLNIVHKKDIKKIIKEAKQRKVSIRIGVNSGGFKRKFSSSFHLASAMVEVVRGYLRIFEEENFSDIIVSLKAQSVWATVLANRMFRKEFDYPLQIGVTATGPYLEGIVKSCLGIGILLSEGIGEVVRVSLLSSSCEEIKIAKAILQFLELRYFFPEVIACPTCSRCSVNLGKIVDKFRKKLGNIQSEKALRIAIMGCVVNGPGEAAQADLGIAFGREKGVIFKEGKVLKRIDKEDSVKELLERVKDAV